MRASLFTTPSSHWLTFLYFSVLLSSSAMSSSFSSSPSVGLKKFKLPLVDLSASDSASPVAFYRYGGTDRSNIMSSKNLATALRGGEISEAEANDIAEANTPDPEPSTAIVQTSKLGPNAPPPGLLRRTFPSFPWHSLPNLLTYARCISIPVFLILAYYPTNFPNRAPTLGLIFALASITDWFDGFLARRWDITSPFGAFLDPVADKLMVSTALIMLAGRYGGIVAIPSSIIMAREVGVSALREWMAQRGKRDSVKVGMQGKVKTALTMLSLTLLLLVPEGVGLESVGWCKYLGPLGVGGAGSVSEGATVAGLPWVLGPSLLMLFASAVVTVTSGSVYFRAAAPVLLGKE